jgi:glutathione peroxidase-family protein
LAQTSENGMMNGTTGGDFQKFLIDKNGLLIAVFAPSIAPMDSLIVNALTNN